MQEKRISPHSPCGEGEILLLIAAKVLQAVSPDYTYAETKVTLDCGGTTFTAKGRTVLDPGWKLYDDAEPREKPLPDLAEGQTLDGPQISVTEGKSQAPASYTEDTLLHAMETAGVKDMPEDAERKGLGTPATRAATVEKPIAAGFVERKEGKRTVSLVPAHAGQSLITILPEQLQSPLLTAEWEHKLKQIEKGTLEPETFLAEITAMLEELVKSYQVIPGGEVLFPSGRTVVGKCPRCGGDVTESRKGFFCERRDCRFGLWRDNKYLAAKRVNLKRSDAEALLRDGQVHMDSLYSEKTGRTYSANLLLDDNGERTVYRVDFS